ncbi:MAG: universal stress protein [Armatimonadetes bacterium]|nr:universal stress protein [Armatimonadota bacterium]
MGNFEVKSILCAVDQSDHSAFALMWAARLAQAFGAKIYVFHSACLRPPLEFTHDQIDAVLAQLEEATQAAAEIIGSWAAQYLPEDVEWETRVTRRDAVEGILEQADELGVDLIVMGTHGRGGIARWLLGSVAAAVVNDSTRPCLICHHTNQPLGKNKIPQPETILCPVNYTPVAEQCLDASSTLAQALDAQVTLLHCLEPGGTEDDEEQEYQRLCSWVPDAARATCALQEELCKGNAAEQIVQYARQQGADLIVIGGQRRLLADVPVFGTTTERVLRLAPCPVLVLPRQPEESEGDSQ